MYRYLFSFAVLTVLIAGCGGGSGIIGVPSASIQEFTVPVQGNLPGVTPAGSWPDDLIGDDQGNIWFAMHHADEIGRMTPTGQYTGYHVLSQKSLMDSIALDASRGIIWSAGSLSNTIMRLDMATGHVTEFPYVRTNASLGDLALGPDGTVWMTLGYEDGGQPGGLARIDPATNAITEIPPPGLRGGFDGIIVTAANVVWFVELQDNAIGKYENGVITEFSLPRPGVVPTNIAIDSGGLIWVTEQGGNALAKLNPLTGTWTEFQVPTPNALPAGIVVDKFDNVWFTEFNTSKIGVLPAGSNQVVDFSIPTPNSGPEDIKVIKDRIWFTEQYGNKIGTITVRGIPGSP